MTEILVTSKDRVSSPLTVTVTWASVTPSAFSRVGESSMGMVRVEVPITWARSMLPREISVRADSSSWVPTTVMVLGWMSTVTVPLSAEAPPPGMRLTVRSTSLTTPTVMVT